MDNYQHLYTQFLQAHPGIQHFASHSHHYWPDVTLDAHIQYWKDSCKYVDEKWDYIFSEKLPQAQRLIARQVGLPEPRQIAFAPSTHELIYRLISCFPHSRPIKILTTDSEFYSFDRQARRLEEVNRAVIHRVPTEPFANLEERLLQEINKDTYDLIFISRVFFNSGVALKNISNLVRAVKSPETQIVIDDYHGFMALPLDLSSVASRVFYLAGSYKYAQGGEGCCFMWVPPGCKLKPTNTGWFAGFGALSKTPNEVAFASDGSLFSGSTMEFSALYRLVAVLELFEKRGITPSLIHGHVQDLQKRFLAELEKQQHPVLNRTHLLLRDLSHHGHFLTFQTPGEKECEELARKLWSQGIQTDHRQGRLRFGFGLYHDGNYDLSALRSL